jgi:hypothetical protein
MKSGTLPNRLSGGGRDPDRRYEKKPSPDCRGLLDVAIANGDYAMTRDQTMTDLVQDLMRFLAQDPLGVDDVTARVGSVTRDPGVLMPIELWPAVAGVRSARLARYPDSGLPYVLTLTLASAPDARPTLAALKAVLGDYRRARTDFGMPREFIFYPPAEGPHWQVVVIVQIESVNDEIEAAPITSIAFRRDPVTP